MINYLYNADIIQERVFAIQQAITMDQSPYMVIGSRDQKYSLDEIYGYRVTGSLGWDL